MNREDRDTDSTNTNRFKTGIDALATQWLQLHSPYSYAQRRSDNSEVDSAVYLFALLRRYDVANLNQNVVEAVADIQLSEAASLGGKLHLFEQRLSRYVRWRNEMESLFDRSYFFYAFKDNSNFSVWYEHANEDRDQGACQSNSDGSPADLTDDRSVGNRWTVTIP